MKPDVLSMRPIFPASQKILEQEFAVHKLWQADDFDSSVARVSDRIRALVTLGTVGADARLIDALPKLEIIASSGAGLGSIDLGCAKERGIVVTNTPDGEALAESVADLAFGMLLGLARRIYQGDRFVRDGKWGQSQFPLGTKIGNKCFGIVGLGSIGRSAAHRAEALGMTVCYHGPRRKADVSYRYYDKLDALARDADFLLLSCPARRETQNLIDAAVLDALGPDGILINVARGSIVDEVALVSALREKRIAGAALDVYANEPHVPPELTALDNTLLTPHIGSATHEIRSARGERVLANLRSHFSGRPVPNCAA
ncbi:MAG TPA: 2-hydroxyacid dehydrogenase [Burkholderiales bacterium]|nr:2-hydroxyacid dehydrogenase [Burkholderiales bacterium]